MKIKSIVNGRIFPIEEVKDDMFSQRMMGDGIAFLPTEGRVHAPFDGEVISKYPSGHAFGIKHKNGLKVLIHIGIDTYYLGNDIFNTHFEEGDKIKTGQLLVEFDYDKLYQQGVDLSVIMIILNKDLNIDQTERQVSLDDIVLEE